MICFFFQCNVATGYIEKTCETTSKVYGFSIQFQGSVKGLDLSESVPLPWFYMIFHANTCVAFMNIPRSSRSMYSGFSMLIFVFIFNMVG